MNGQPCAYLKSHQRQGGGGHPAECLDNDFPFGAATGEGGVGKSKQSKGLSDYWLDLPCCKTEAKR